MKTRSNALVYGCLILSGSTSLIYELLWTRIFSFSFGSTSLAFAAVLAVFFLGLAGGSVLGGRAARRLSHPFRAYAWLELAIGVYAGAAFPFLFKLHHLFALHNAGGAEPSGLAFRFLVAAAVLALPTLCMGATFPILLEHLRRSRSHLSEALGRLYGINTLGAFLGVYLATHWLVPGLGLDKANYFAVILNVVVFALVFALGGPALAADPVPGETGRTQHAPAPRRLAAVGLILLSASGFTTLIYEVVWGRVLTISMEGSLYGIGTTLGSFLAGIGLGGVAFSFLARRLRSPESLFHAYVAVCLMAIAYLALSRFVLPVEGYLLKAVTQSMRGLSGLHAAFALGVLFLLPVTAALGFMFPAAVALYTHGQANPAEGAGKAYALNTVLSVFGSLASATYLMDKLGIEGIVFLGALIMLGSLLAAVLLAEAGRPRRRAWLALVAIPLIAVAGWWPAIDAKTVLVDAQDRRRPNLSSLFRNLAAQFSPANPFKVYKDGVGTTLTVTLNGRTAGLQSNGLPQSGRDMDPPHFNLESSLVGLFPLLHKPDAKDALVIGLGAGITVGVLRMAAVPEVEVVELEPSMADICRGIYPKGRSPLDDTGVTLRLDDARNFLVRNGYRAEPRRWDLIASQPAHPWVSGAADLFTEEMFRLAYANLAEGGVFCQWFMPSGIDARAYASLANAFGNVFDQAIVYRGFGGASGLYFIGYKGKPGISLPAMEEVLSRPGLRQLLDLHGHREPADFFKYALTGLVDGASLRAADMPVNRDRNAFVESRMPLIPKAASLPVAGIPGLEFTGPIPTGFRGASARETLFVYEAIDGLSGNIPAPRPPLESDSLRIARLGAFARSSPTPFREYYRQHLGLAGRSPGSLDSLEAAAMRADSAGASTLAARLRHLRLRTGPAPAWAAGRPRLDSLPADFARAYRSLRLLSLAEAAAKTDGKPPPADSAADSLSLAMASVLGAWSRRDTSGVRFAKASLDGLYRKALLDWPHRDDYLAALAWYCRAAGRESQALMAERVRNHQAEQAVNRMLAEGMRLKKAKDHAGALRIFSAVLARNPSAQNAYMAMAEIYGREKRESDYRNLIASIREVIPQPDVTLQRVGEAFELITPADDSSAVSRN